ncbi:MAG: DNA repair protein RadC [Tidjanibacter sp.]|nr:DNA repair protein RadC [Tidjanibacter sp.]
MANDRDREVREKLVLRGAGLLSAAELLSLIIGPDSAGESALASAERLLNHYDGSLASLLRAELPELRSATGLGIKRASALAAALELGRRAAAEQVSPVVIHDKNDVVALFPTLAGLSHEEMWVVYLTSSNRVIEKRRVAQGGVSALVADHKLITKRALELLAQSVILVHNHPSGSASPSAEDEAVTSRIAEAMKLFDIKLLDHIIISREGDYSFRHFGKL